MTENASVTLLGVALLGPIVAAIIPFLTKDDRRTLWSRVILLLSTLAGSVLAFALATGDGTALIVSSAFGQPLTFFYGMPLIVDKFAAIFLLAVNVGAFLATLFSMSYVKTHATLLDGNGRTALFALVVFGTEAVVLSGNIVGFLFAWSLTFLALGFLVSLSGTDGARRAGLRILFAGMVSGAAIAAGMFLLSDGALFTTFDGLTTSSSGIPLGLQAVAFVLLLVGFGMGSALLPFAFAFRSAYHESPAHIGALVTGAVVPLGIYGLLRSVLFFFASVTTTYSILLIVVGCVAALTGALLFATEKDLKRATLAPSVIAIGTVFAFIGLALFAGNSQRWELMNAMLFASVLVVLGASLLGPGLAMMTGTIVSRLQTRSLDAMGGVAIRLPILAVCSLVLFAAAGGLPPFAPFLATWLATNGIVDAAAGAKAGVLTLFVIFLVIFGAVFLVTFAGMCRLFAAIFLGTSRTISVQSDGDNHETMHGIGVAAALAGALGLFAPFMLQSLGAPDMTASVGTVGAAVVGAHSSFAPILFALALIVVIAVIVGVIRLAYKPHEGITEDRVAPPPLPYVDPVDILPRLPEWRLPSRMTFFFARSKSRVDGYLDRTEHVRAEAYVPVLLLVVALTVILAL